MSISIIIPTLNEEQCIERLLSFLTRHSEQEEYEVIMVDGGSSDSTLSIAQNFPVKIIRSEKASRAYQMNLGVQHAQYDVLYFVHADVGLTDTFVRDIQTALEEGYTSGCFSCRFVDPSLALLKINALFTRFSFRWCRGGDQTLFITRKQFEDLGGYNEEMVIMEDYDLLDKLLESDSFKVIKKDVQISARKYRGNSYLKVQLANLKAMRMYRRGEPSKKIRDFYVRSLKL